MNHRAQRTRVALALLLALAWGASRDAEAGGPRTVSVFPDAVRVSVESGGHAVVTFTNNTGKRVRITRFGGARELVADVALLEEGKIPTFAPLARTGFEMGTYGRARVRIKPAPRTPAGGAAKTLEIEYVELGDTNPRVLRVRVELFDDPVKCATAEDVCFIAFGDQGTGDDLQANVGKAMAQFIGPADRPKNRTDFLIGLGDNFYTAGVHGCRSDQFKSKFELPYAAIDKKFYMTMGNHDVIVGSDPDYQVCYAKTDSIDAAPGPKFTMPSRYYTFTAGPVQFFALYTPGIVREEYTVALSKKALREQVKWLDKELAKSSARWKIVYGHHPAFSYAWRQGPEIYQHLLPLFVKHKVDLYVTGHDHSQHHYLHPQYRDLDFITTGSAGGKAKGTEAPHTGDYARFETPERGFVYFKISGDTITFQVVNEHGVVLYPYTRKQPRQRQTTIPTMPRCAPGRERSLGQCFPACRPGFDGNGPTCYETCPPGYHADLATCRRNVRIIKANTRACPWHDKCGLVTSKGCSKCPDGYHNDGCTCRIDAHVFGRASYNRSEPEALFVFGKGW